MGRQNYSFTSESVSEGHPDKVCDRISDEIVDLIYKEAKKTGVDPWTVRIAAETLTTTNRVVIAGEVRVPPRHLLGPTPRDDGLVLPDGGAPHRTSVDVRHRRAAPRRIVVVTIILKANRQEGKERECKGVRRAWRWAMRDKVRKPHHKLVTS